VISVILLYPNGQRREVILETIPVEGDDILLKDDRVPLHVEHRLHMEAGDSHGPSTLISVRPIPQ
jgi:hypothetical protein